MNPLIISPNRSSGTLHRRQQSPKRSRTYSLWALIIGGICTLVAGSIWMDYNANLVHTDVTQISHLLTRQKQQGLPSSEVEPENVALTHLAQQKVWGVPAAWLGGLAGEPQKLKIFKQKAVWLYGQYDKHEETLARRLGQELSQRSAASAPLTVQQVASQLKQASRLRSREQLVARWQKMLNAWRNSVSALSTQSGGLVAGRPKDVVEAATALEKKLAATPSNWQGIGTAQDALADVHRYWSLAISQQLSQHHEILQELQAAQDGLQPPSHNPFGQTFQQYLATRQGVVSAAVYDAQNGTTYTFQPTQRFATASIVKATIMSTLLWQSQQSDQPLTSSEQQLMVPMIEDSSNSAATALWNDAGRSQGINSFLQAAGMTQTDPGKGGFWGLTSTTAVDQVQLLRLLSYPNHVLTPASQSYAANLMQHVVGWEGWGVSGGVAPGATVALKNGWLPIAQQGWEINSIGHVSGDGRNYVVALLSRGNPSESYGIQTLSTVSAMIWNKMAS